MKRFTLIGMVMAAMALSSLEAWAAATFNLSFSDTPVEQVISDLRKRTGYDFVYQKEVLAGNPKISGSFSNLTLEQILNRVFVEDLNVSYEIVDKTIILSKASKELPYFKRNVSGVVCDEAGEPLIGATVLVEDALETPKVNQQYNLAVRLELTDRVRMAHVENASPYVRIHDMVPFTELAAMRLLQQTK